MNNAIFQLGILSRFWRFKKPGFARHIHKYQIHVMPNTHFCYDLIPPPQVLLNLDSASRLEWLNWEQFQPLPKGTVSVDRDVFVARAWENIPPSQQQPLVPRSSGVEIRPSLLHLGGLYLQEQYGLIMVAIGPEGGGGGQMDQSGQRRHTKGQILVEHEPISFEIQNFRYLYIVFFFTIIVRILY